MLGKEDESSFIERLDSYGFHLLYPPNAVLRIFSACEDSAGKKHLKLLNGDVAYIHPVEKIHAELLRYVIASQRRHDETMGCELEMMFHNGAERERCLPKRCSETEFYPHTVMIRIKEIGKDCTRFTLSNEHLENLLGRDAVRAPDISRRGNRNATLLSSIESAVAAPCWPAIA